MADLAEHVVAALRRWAAEGLLEEGEVSYWDRGGPPGLGFESDIVRVSGDPKRRVRLEAKRTRVDDEYHPPFRVEAYRCEQACDVRSIVEALLESNLFFRTFPEERDPGVGGATKYTFAFQFAGRSAAHEGFRATVSTEKTFFESVPKELAGLKAQFEALLKHGLKTGDKMIESTRK